ncbi:zinc-ribbon domain-containing protein [Paenibacillus senegalimassiliensis]|uniref:zinc-ribbon domain-containing protein n=1 Tax=Paenibacillus senegalimassiliensis TaxID=1737426 RepID=UPI00073F1BD8|nr:zinc-ribbon domain-containing protein [Paenibacillus senegalimassiliensis]
MNILQRLKDGAGKVTDRAQNVVEIGKLNTQISNIERELGLYFQKMGEVFYDAYRKKDMSEADKEMLDLAKTCDLLTEERDEIRLKVAELKNERLCGACGRSVAEEAMFCQYCGHKLLKVKPAAAKEEYTEAPVKETSIDAIAAPGVNALLEEDVFVPSESQTSEPKVDGKLEKLLAATLQEDQIEYRAPQREFEPAQPEFDPEEEERLQRDLERERKRQDDLDLRIRKWTETAEAAVQTEEPVQEPPQTRVATVKCQICGSILVKGTKWCPHCGSEQI